MDCWTRQILLCHNRYKKPSQLACWTFQPGLGIKLEKSLVLHAPVDFTAAPKSWLGVIQFDTGLRPCS
ncbi:MAG TPA: hypothetical protein V6D50_07395 [Chroococcales cyanobacterium]|jgi:hypothetical protein